MPYRDEYDHSQPPWKNRYPTSAWAYEWYEADEARSARWSANLDRCTPISAEASRKLAEVRDKERVRCAGGCGSNVWADPGVATQCDWCEMQDEACRDREGAV